MSHSHTPVDSDKSFVINPIDKTITNPSGNKNTVIQYDHNSEVFTFQIPKIIEGHDMTESDSIQIHYINEGTGTSASIRSSNPGIYVVKDIKVDSENEDLVMFTWPLSQDGTRLSGTIKFQVKFICYSDEPGIPSYKWQTKVFSAINVEAGIENSEIIVEENLDVILSFEERISALEESLKNNTGSGTVTNEQIANAVENYILENPVEGEKGEDGASAYEIALENGFEGSETEWLDSLKGEKGTDGKAGASVAIVEVNESTVDGGSNIITFSDGSTFTVKNGNKGSAGDTGLTGANGVDGYSPTATVTQTDIGAVITITDESGTTTARVTNGADGKDGANGTNGKDGVSCTHSWNGTTLTVTSASGTSSVNLKGDKGDTGAKGEQGIQGEKGENGSDYILTDSDKTDIARMVIESLGGNPVFGYVDENNNIIVSGKLVDGTYSVKYEMEDGTTLDIGDLILAESEPETEVVINQITISTDESGNLFNDGKGYKSGYRLSLSSGNESAEADYEVTGFIPVKYNDIIRIKNIDISQHDWINVVFYNADKTKLSTSGISGTQLYHMFVTNGTESDGVYEAKLSGDIHNSITSEVAYIRVGSQSITDESIITVNQEIV